MPVIENPKRHLIPVGDGPKQLGVISRIGRFGVHASIVSRNAPSGSRSSTLGFREIPENRFARGSRQKAARPSDNTGGTTDEFAVGNTGRHKKPGRDSRVGTGRGA